MAGLVMSDFRELIARLAGHTTYRVPVEGRSTKKGRELQDIAQALGCATQYDRFGADMAFKIATGFTGRDDWMRMQMFLWTSKWLRSTGRNLTTKQLFWVVCEVMTDLSENRKHNAANKAADLGIRKQDYIDRVSPAYFALKEWCDKREASAVYIARNVYFDR